MAHYAQVRSGLVVDVIVIDESKMKDFISSSPGKWIQTSYNTRSGVHYDPVTGQPSADQSKALRKNYAGIGYSYDQDLDAFIPPKLFESWQLNEVTCQWDSPSAIPDDGKAYMWDEESVSWKEATAA